jgi:hypothetical protein
VVDLVSRFLFAGSGVVGDGNSRNRALLGAHTAAVAAVFDDVVFKEILTNARGTLVVYNVSLILVSEVTQS